MLSINLQTLALLASLLVKETFAAPIYEIEYQVVTEEVAVTKQLDGSYKTGAPRVKGTFTRHSAASYSSSFSSVYVPAPATQAAVTTVVVVPTASPVVETPAPVPAEASSSVESTSTEAEAVLIQTDIKEVAEPTAITSSTHAIASSRASSSSGKRGVAYNNAAYVSSFTGSSHVSWAYNWGASSSGLSASGIEYVPLLWGLQSDHTSSWSSAATSAIASGSKYLMSFNEPDLSNQANLGYADAAAGYRKYMQPFAGRAKLGAPAVTNGAAPMGLTWLKNFLSLCTDCTIDFVAIHWYDSASNVDYFKNYIQDAYTAGGNRPLWITEFQASGTTDQQNAFMKEVLPWLDACNMVDRYAWFMASTQDGGLVSGAGALNTLGNTFKTT